MVVGAGCVRPTVGEGGGRKARICAFIDVKALTQLLARVLHTFVTCLALAVPLATPLAMVAATVLVALSSTTCVRILIPLVPVAL